MNAVLNKARDDAGKKAQNSLTLHVSDIGVLHDESPQSTSRYYWALQLTPPPLLLAPGMCPTP